MCAQLQWDGTRSPAAQRLEPPVAGRAAGAGAGAGAHEVEDGRRVRTAREGVDGDAWGPHDAVFHASPLFAGGAETRKHVLAAASSAASQAPLRPGIDGLHEASPPSAQRASAASAVSSASRARGARSTQARRGPRPTRAALAGRPRRALSAELRPAPPGVRGADSPGTARRQDAAGGAEERWAGGCGRGRAGVGRRGQAGSSRGRAGGQQAAQWAWAGLRWTVAVAGGSAQRARPPARKLRNHNGGCAAATVPPLGLHGLSDDAPRRPPESRALSRPVPVARVQAGPGLRFLHLRARPRLRALGAVSQICGATRIAACRIHLRLSCPLPLPGPVLPPSRSPIAIATAEDCWCGIHHRPRPQTPRSTYTPWLPRSRAAAVSFATPLWRDARAVLSFASSSTTPTAANLISRRHWFANLSAAYLFMPTALLSTADTVAAGQHHPPAPNSMDLFKRNNGPPRSRQGSLDAAFMDDRSAESWAPGSHAQSHPDLPSPPDRRLRDQSNVRRSSVFTLRSRSNTANSMSSKAPNFDDQDRSQRRSSRDISAMNAAHGSSGSISEPAAGKQKPSSMFASRGRKLRRQSSKLSSTAAAADDVEEVSSGRRSSVFGKDRKRSTYETVEQYNLRMRHISSPFDFQHLTHTNSQHLQQALESSQNELVAEFWAHRASQMPNKELRGIKVEALTSTNGSSDALSTATQPNSDSSSIDRSSIVSPKTRELPKHQSPSPKSDPQAVRHTRSMGSFSQPIPPTSPKSPKSQDPHVPMVPPPRMSSRLASSRGEDTPIAQAISSSRRTSGVWNNSFHRPSVSNEFINDLPFIPHAITTPDDTAMPSVSPSWNATDLEHIAEEEEGYFGRKSYDQSILYSPSPEMSPTQKPDTDSDLPLRSDHMGPHEQLKSFANHRPSRPRPLSQMSDTLGAPFCPPQSGKKTPGAMGALQRSASMRRRSTFFRSLEDTNTWEDDIDYCYDIGADADCDFEWDRMSNEAKANYTPNEPSFAIRTSTVMEEDEEEEDEQDDGCGTEEKLNSGFMPNTFRPSLVVPSKTSIPDLDYRSAVSTSTNSLLTPVEGYTSNNPKDRSTAAYHMGEDQGAYTPSLLVPQDFKEQVAKEEMYEDLLNDYESDRHYPLMHARSDNTLSIAESSRSGPSRYSMGSSYESSLRSASVSLASPARAARSSTGSVPDLVHSRRAARRTMEIMVNRLSKELTFEDDEDCDGSASTEQQTFFADDQDGSDDETEDNRKPESRPTTRGGAMPAEAMMRSPVSPYHERSASDGAAKLLAKAGVKAQHARTASSESQTQRRGSKTYTLSLFPAPPKTPKNF